MINGCRWRSRVSSHVLKKKQTAYETSSCNYNIYIFDARTFNVILPEQSTPVTSQSHDITAAVDIKLSSSETYNVQEQDYYVP